MTVLSQNEILFKCLGSKTDILRKFCMQTRNFSNALHKNQILFGHNQIFFECLGYKSNAFWMVWYKVRYFLGIWVKIRFLSNILHGNSKNCRTILAKIRYFINALCTNKILIERFVSESLFFKYFESEPDASRMLSLQNTAHCQFLRRSSTLFEYSRPKSDTSPMF